MTTGLLKKELTKAIAAIDDKALLEALYTIIHKTDKYEFEYEMNESELAIIEERSKRYKSGKAKVIPVKEIRSRFMSKFK